MFRLALIDFMDAGILNKFVNEVFRYKLKDNEYVYMQYKIVKGSIVLNIFDNKKENRFKGYIFSDGTILDEKDNIVYIDTCECYKKYKNKRTKNKLYLIGALLKAKDDGEKEGIIRYFSSDDIKEILKKHFL